ncbi:hypothetical protein MTR67_030889 [Solanum verrucosum]|uniref:Reverse transcriptase domain-containing protein n=1 Tax=Solanum verrucosum TaxID=315347 RepID=A0AAF0ZGR5_SOLVR|nr:hypothetical protein MTR67_030889 [Solanum verrucosum]
MRYSSAFIITDILKAYHLDSLLDPGATLSFLKSYVAMRNDILPDVLVDLFFVFTSIGESIVANRVYIGSPISLSHIFTHVDLVELDMLDLDVIIGYGIEFFLIVYEFLEVFSNDLPGVAPEKEIDFGIDLL